MPEETPLSAAPASKGTRLRVLVVSNMYPTARDARFGRFVRDAVRALESEGVEVGLAVVGGSGSLGRYARLALAVARAAARGGFDAVHAHYLFPTALLALLAAKVRRVPLIAYSHGSDVLLASWRWPIGALTRYATRAADLVLVPSAEHGRIVRETFGLPAEHVEVVPIGVDLTVFVPGDRQAAREQLDIRAEDTRILFVGALDDNKGAGLEDVIWVLGRDPFAHVRLTVIGEGPREASLHAIAERYGVERRVQFLPFQPQDSLLAHMRAADVVVVPSRRESLGLVALEAQAVGTPVVAAAVGGLPEHVVPGQTGELYASGDVADLERALATALQGAGAGRYRPAIDAARFGLAETGRRLLAATRRSLEGRR